MLNFTWWVNRKDPHGATSSRAASSASTTSASSIAARRCPPGDISSRRTARRGWRSTARTCWRSPLDLAGHDPTYEDMALQVPRALPLDRLRDGSHRRQHDEHVGRGGRLLLRPAALPDGDATRLKVRSMVGLLPLCAATVLEPGSVEAHARTRGARAHCSRAPCRSCSSRFTDRRELVGYGGRHAGRRLQQDDSAASSRACSTRTSSSARTASGRCPRYHATHPYFPASTGRSTRVRLPARPNPTPACSAATPTGAGPIWMPVNVLLIRALLNYYRYYGDDFKVECPTDRAA